MVSFKLRHHRKRRKSRVRRKTVRMTEKMQTRNKAVGSEAVRWNAAQRIRSARAREAETGLGKRKLSRGNIQDDSRFVIHSDGI